MTPLEFAVKYGPDLGKALAKAFTSSRDRERALVLTHEKAESTARFHVLTAKKHAAERAKK